MILKSQQWQLTTLESMCDITREANGEAFFSENQFLSKLKAAVIFASDSGSAERYCDQPQCTAAITKPHSYQQA